MRNPGSPYRGIHTTTSPEPPTHPLFRQIAVDEADVRTTAADVAQREEAQYLHLGWLAWGLREAGITVTLELRRGQEPCLVLRRTLDARRITADRRAGVWGYTWGPATWVEVCDLEAALRALGARA